MGRVLEKALNSGERSSVRHCLAVSLAAAGVEGWTASDSTLAFPSGKAGPSPPSYHFLAMHSMVYSTLSKKLMFAWELHSLEHRRSRSDGKGPNLALLL